MTRLMAPQSRELDNNEMKRGAIIGKRRSDEAIRMGGKDQHGFTGDKYGISIMGAQGELALNKIRGTSWDESVNTFKTKADVGLDIEVRATDHPNGCLLFRYHIDNDFYNYTCDKPDILNRKYVLMIVDGNKFTAVGWLWGYQIVKKINDKYVYEKYIRDYNDRPPAWFIPQHELNKDLSALEES